MSDDGRLLTLGALGALLLGGAAAAGSRASKTSKAWIHYDAVAKNDIAKLTTMANEMIARGMNKREVDRLLADAMSKSPELERRGMAFVNAFLEAGQQVFVVGPRLEELFVNTSLDRVPRDAIAAPYPAFWVALPSSELRLYSQRNGWCALRGMYVDASEEGAHDLLGVGAVGLNPRRPRSSGGPPRFIRLLLYGPIPTAAEPNATNEAYQYLDLEEIYGTQGVGDLEDYLVGKLAEATRLRNLTLPADVLAEITSTQIQALRIAVNLMLYTNANGAEITPDPDYLAELAAFKKLMAEKQKIARSGERERAKRREIERIDAKILKLSGATVVRLGQGIEDRSEALQGGSGKRRRHWVRGHWRMPARKHGERQLTWVQPYERNVEEEARVTRHVYKGEPGEN